MFRQQPRRPQSHRLLAACELCATILCIGNGHFRVLCVSCRPQESSSGAVRLIQSCNGSRLNRAISPQATSRSSHLPQLQNKPLRMTQSCNGSPRGDPLSRSSSRGHGTSGYQQQHEEAGIRSSSSSRNGGRSSSQKEQWQQLKRAHSPSVVPELQPLQLPFSRWVCREGSN